VIPAPGEKGNETWAGDTWKNGGGAVWLTGTYDPETNLLYFGTGNPAPWIAQMRPGANLWTNSSIALDVETGSIKWGYQHLANEGWDYDTAMEHLVMEVPKGNRWVKAVVQANKLGFVNIGCVYFATTPSTLVFYSFIEPCLVSRFFLQKPVSGGHEPEASRRIWPGDCVDTLGFHGTSNTHRNRH